MGFKGKVVTQDARDAVAGFARQGQSFDAVVVDITDTGLSKEDAEHLEHVLKPGGLILENWTMREAAKGPMLQHLEDINHRFDAVGVLSNGETSNNIVYGQKASPGGHAETLPIF